MRKSLKSSETDGYRRDRSLITG